MLRLCCLGLAFMSISLANSEVTNHHPVPSTTTTTTPLSALTTRRRLEDDVTFEYNDLSDYSVVFQKCQLVKMFDDELAENKDSTTVLAMKHFVIYKLCPTSTTTTTSSSSSSDGGCSSYDCQNGIHGEYVISVQDYLESTVQYQQELLDKMCNNCNDDDSSCSKICYQYENMEANGFVDATQFIECQKVDIANDNDDNNDDGEEEEEEELELYIGPRCSEGKIAIGLFTDENCVEPYEDREVTDVLGVKLSYRMLSSVQKTSQCLSCKEEQDNDNNNNDAADADDVNEMCEGLYSESGKCESPYGLEGGFIQMNRDNNNNGEVVENQVENEFMVCTFISSLIWNSYTETGEININDVQDEILRATTPLQKASLSLITIALLVLGIYAYFLTQHIQRATTRVSLSAQTQNTLI